MRRSGVSPAVKRSKFSREMLRRAASGHIEATQLSKFAAASRVALAVISGWPEAPSSPLQGWGPVAPGVACGGVPAFGPEKILPNKLGSPPEDCAPALPAHSKAAAIPIAAGSALVHGCIGRFMFHRCPAFRA